jgi:hypothetical protein
MKRPLIIGLCAIGVILCLLLMALLLLTDGGWLVGLALAASAILFCVHRYSTSHRNDDT